MTTGLEWRRNPTSDDLISTVKPWMFFRIFPDRMKGGFFLWLVKVGISRDHLGWFATESDAQDAAEKYTEERQW